MGARPQFIKLSPLVRALEALGLGGADFEIIHSGQHFDANMSANFFSELSLPAPTENLRVAGEPFSNMVPKLQLAFSEVLHAKSPSKTVVIGDTATTLGASLAAFTLGLDLYHVEAGLRSFDMSMPEEKARTLTDRMAQVNFAPSRTGMANLENEGLSSTAVFAGDVGYEILSSIAQETQEGPDKNYSSTKPNILVTLHRPANVDDAVPLGAIIDGLNKLASEQGANITLINHPRTSANLRRFGLENQLKNFCILEPRSFRQTLQSIRGSELVITDSGGLQREAFYMGKPIWTIRSTTEWVEVLEVPGNVLLEPSDVGSRSLDYLADYKVESNPYVSSSPASEIIARHLLELD